MPDGHYDEEAGMCYPDEAGAPSDDQDWCTDEPEYESQLPEECQNPWGGYNDDCLDAWMLDNALERLWDYLFGESD